MFVAQGGDPFNMGDPRIPASQQRPLFIGRNTIRGQSIYQIGRSLLALLPDQERFRPEFLAEAWNVFNHSNVTNYNTTATVDAAGNIVTRASLLQTAALDSRLLQIGVKFSW